MNNRKTKSILGAIVLCLVVMLMAVESQPEMARAAATGYTDHGHNFTTASKCGSAGCNGTKYSSKKAYAGLNGNTICSKCSGKKTISCTNTKCSSGKVTCSACSGLGYTSKTFANSSGSIMVNGTLTKYGCYERDTACTTCGGSGSTTRYFKNSTPTGGSFYTMGTKTNGSGKVDCSTCGGDAKITCTQCSGSGYYGLCGRCNGTGKNYKCQNSACIQGYYNVYDNWKTEPNYNSICYTTENTYTIAFNANGGSGSMSSLSSCLYDDSYTLTANAFTRTGYTFAGWNTKADGTGTSYGNKTSVSKLSATNGATVTLYAQWTENTYTITFNGNGNTGGSTASLTGCKYTGSFTLTANGFTKTGYTFAGWNTKADGTGTSYGNKTSVSKLSTTNGATVTLYAQWKANEQTLTFYPAGGTVSVQSKKIYYDSLYGELPTPVREGYTFLGWYTGMEDGVKILPSDTFQETTNQILYARWNRDAYQVRYHGNGGVASVDLIENFYGEAVDLSVASAKEGYLFVGWNTDPDATCGLSSMTMPESDVDLYAIYSIPVSDIKDVYLKIWPKGNAENYRIYYLGKTDAQNMKYTYNLGSNDIISFLNGATPEYTVIVLDYAGNSTAIVGDDEEPKYVQIVEHYMLKNGVQTKFDTVTEERYKGETYNPQYVTAPVGYKPVSISSGYIVSGDTVSKAYYEPIEYKLSFDANGGTCQVNSKTICYGDAYGELPTPVYEGYTFMGWYTEKENGLLVKSESKYLLMEDSTVYAHWQVNNYQVIYDYKTNGGDSASLESATVSYGADIDLSVKAQKEGWTFIGWNTDPDATHALSSLRMGNKDVVLYAIYQKEIVVSFVSQTMEGVVTNQESITLFNKESQAIIAIPEQGFWEGWTSLGWTLSTAPEGSINASAGSFYVCKESLTFYGRYSKEVAVTYDTNGSSVVITPQHKTRFYNAYGTYSNPSFVIAAAPTLDNSSFVTWIDMESGNVYVPKSTVVITENVLLTAKWDMYPLLQAYNRYFTLDEAKNGFITEAALLSKVVGTDAEDGILVNGVDVTVLGYDANVFTSLTTDADVDVTYQAIDSFGNTVTKTITVQVVDTTVKVSNRRTYYRFISNRFYKDGENYVPANKGGLEETSVWKTNPVYQSLMDAVMSNKKINQVIKKISFYGNEKEYVVPGSGTWEHVEETWYFTKEDIVKSNEFREQYGFGSSKVTNYLEKFLEWFGHCKQ